MYSVNNDTIAAIATPPGTGAISIIRVSGEQAIALCAAVFTNKSIKNAAANTIHYGHILDEHQEKIDEVMMSIFHAPKSFTGENCVEISCHGSPFICQQILLTLHQQGVRAAQAGEFSLRAYLNKRIDLTQAEAIADMIHAHSESSRKIAMHHLRGGFSHDLKQMREQLIHFAALIELELDFSEEDVEFADRKKLVELIDALKQKVQPLTASFQLGNAIKNGVAVAIVGKPNAGKSTLLNALLNEERAIVSEIAGTTRDTIEDTLHIDGILFRFIDTAGIRQTDDIIEHAGIERAKSKMREADIILYLADINENYRDISSDVNAIEASKDQQLLVVLTKLDTLSHCDGYDMEEAVSTLTKKQCIALSAKEKLHIDRLKNSLHKSISHQQKEDTIISNVRHYEALKKVEASLVEIQLGIEGAISNELVAQELRRCLHFISEITGDVDVDRDILGKIFGSFCIGK